MTFGLSDKTTPHYYLFWRNDFSQWAMRVIQDIDGTSYNCAEQYMMAKKALLFGDHDALARIMQAQTPKEQQRIGRTVQGFDADTWNTHKFAIVWAGNFLKFTQHPDLQKKLLNSGDRIIAEASPEDLVWGIGYAPDDALALDQSKWRGQNLLGHVLMSVRAAIGCAGLG